MRLIPLRIACLALCLGLVSITGGRRLLAQDNAPQQGQGRGFGGGRGMFMMGGNSAIGTVTAISGTHITIRDQQGQVYKVETGPNTHIRGDRQDAKFSDIHVGDVIVAAGNVDEQVKTVGAMFVVVLDAQQAARMKQAQADFGKTWTMGKVTAIDLGHLTVTVERPDKVSQTIAVNENTEFRKRGPDGEEDIAFPDIKAGDRVMVRGSLQNGSFVATDIGVMGPRGERRSQQPGPGGPPPPSPQPPASPQK